VKLNHNEFLTYPNSYDQIMFGTVKQACGDGRRRRRRHDLFRLAESERARSSRSRGLQQRPRAGRCHRPVVLHGNAAFKTKDDGLPPRADLTGQANHLGVTIEADIIKQKLPGNNGGLQGLPGATARPTSASTTQLTTRQPDRPDRYQVANCYMGRAA
jgi:class I fructose-bisphosphate aldolase